MFAFFLASLTAPPTSPPPEKAPRITSIVLLAPGESAPTGPPPPQPRPGGGVGPTADLLPLFSSDDYPADALRKHEVGVVSATLKVSKDGKLSDCIIDQSSGSPSLDQATCDIIRQRGTFIPAKTVRGTRSMMK